MCKLPNHSGLEHKTEGAPRMNLKNYGAQLGYNASGSYGSSMNYSKGGAMNIAPLIKLTTYVGGNTHGKNYRN